ncbi:MAG: hypothetical protein IPG99_00795 [Ignavibacteria bacterium]|nr:hypothetical protein [Ignavibacteria bacterium]
MTNSSETVTYAFVTYTISSVNFANIFENGTITSEDVTDSSVTVTNSSVAVANSSVGYDLLLLVTKPPVCARQARLQECIPRFNSKWADRQLCDLDYGDPKQGLGIERK